MAPDTVITHIGRNVSPEGQGFLRNEIYFGTAKISESR